MTPDDRAVTHTDTDSRWRARQNVIMELGWFMARLGRDRVVILYSGELELPSDILGVVFLEFKEKIGEVADRIYQRLKGVERYREWLISAANHGPGVGARAPALTLGASPVTGVVKSSTKLVGGAECRPGAGGHIVQQRLLPGELRVRFEMRGSVEVAATGVAG
jgi:hypothetical protein